MATGLFQQQQLLHHRDDACLHSIEAMRRATQATGVEHGFFVGRPDPKASRYDLYVELVDVVDPAERRRFGQAVDEALTEVNVEYESKRGSDRLAPLRVVPLVPRAFDRYRELRLAEGALAGQLKWLHLSNTEATRRRMEQLKAPGAEAQTD